TSRALIDMESGELLLRVHDECLIFNVYKPMYLSSDTKSCMKIHSNESLHPEEPPNKLPHTLPLCKSVNKEPKPTIESTTTKLSKDSKKKHKKKDKGEKGKQDFADKLSLSHQALEVQNPPLIWVDNKQQVITKDVRSKNFDPP
ncbi:hypothetical protein PIB30_065639, partial [Stylosanthes scabra]|nr:hypothetical protein [Stylosanthes scabra]